MGCNILCYSRAEQLTRKLKLGGDKLPHTGISHAKLWWVWFPGIKTRILQPAIFFLSALEPNSKILHPRKFPAIRYLSGDRGWTYLSSWHFLQTFGCKDALNLIREPCVVYTHTILGALVSEGGYRVSEVQATCTIVGVVSKPYTIIITCYYYGVLRPEINH